MSHTIKAGPPVCFPEKVAIGPFASGCPTAVSNGGLRPLHDVCNRRYTVNPAVCDYHLEIAKRRDRRRVQCEYLGLWRHGSLHVESLNRTTSVRFEHFGCIGCNLRQTNPGRHLDVRCASAGFEFTTTDGNEEPDDSDLVARSPLQIKTTSLPDGRAGANYAASVNASGGTPPYSWSVTAGRCQRDWPSTRQADRSAE